MGKAEHGIPEHQRDWALTYTHSLSLPFSSAVPNCLSHLLLHHISVSLSFSEETFMHCFINVYFTFLFEKLLFFYALNKVFLRHSSVFHCFRSFFSLLCLSNNLAFVKPTLSFPFISLCLSLSMFVFCLQASVLLSFSLSFGGAWLEIFFLFELLFAPKNERNVFFSSTERQR